jgi:hypothetical protein
MTTYAYTADPLARQHVKLATANRATVPANVLALVASLIDNDSSVAGTTVKDALNNLVALSAWDHVVQSVADLPTPVAGNRTLTTGSWAFAAPVNIGDTTLYVPAGTTVYLRGMGHDKLLTNTGGGVDAILVEGTASIDGLSVYSTAGRTLELASSTGAVQASGCRWEAGGAFPTAIVDGHLQDTGSTYLNSGTGVCMATFSGGEGVDLSGCSVTADNNAAAVQFVTANRFEAINTRFASNAPSGDPVFLVNNANAVLRLVDSVIAFDAASVHGLRVTSADSVTITGGRFEGSSNGYGLVFFGGGTVSGAIMLDGVNFANITRGISYASGTIRAASVVGCRFKGTTGMTWAAASVPTLGLAIVGNIFDVTTPFSGFTAASAGVNAKANMDTAGLMTETAIV